MSKANTEETESESEESEPSSIEWIGRVYEYDCECMFVPPTRENSSNNELWQDKVGKDKDTR